MWTCEKCGRIFGKAKQPHSCRKVELEQHFAGKAKARELFEVLVKLIEKRIGKCQIVSIPCCIHLFGKYDFLAALPKKKGLEIRFALDRVIESPRINQAVAMSSKVFKNCLEITMAEELDEELVGWIGESYRLKNGK